MDSGIPGRGVFHEVELQPSVGLTWLGQASLKVVSRQGWQVAAGYWPRVCLFFLTQISLQGVLTIIKCDLLLPL